MRRRDQNVALRSRMRTAVKKVLSAIQAGDKQAATEQYRAAVPEIDRMASKGIIGRNRAAHYKSQLNRRLKDMA